MLYKTIKPAHIKDNAVELIANEWTLITAGDAEKYNTMTASWGMLGHMWSRDAVSVVVRPQRYTKEFLDKKGHFTLCFFGKGEDAKAIHKICGSKSGREVDKTALTGLQPVYDEAHDTVYFEGARLVLVCKKLYAAPFDPDCFADTQCRDEIYPNKDYHTQYFGKIVEAMELCEEK